MIGECMKRQVVYVSPTTTVLDATRLVVERHIGTLPVVDEQGVLIGVVRLQDILDIFMPDFVRLLEDIDFIHDFGVLESAAAQGYTGRRAADHARPDAGTRVRRADVRPATRAFTVMLSATFAICRWSTSPARWSASLRW